MTKNVMQLFAGKSVIYQRSTGSSEILWSNATKAYVFYLPQFPCPPEYLFLISNFLPWVLTEDQALPSWRHQEIKPLLQAHRKELAEWKGTFHSSAASLGSSRAGNAVHVNEAGLRRWEITQQEGALANRTVKWKWWWLFLEQTGPGPRVVRKCVPCQFRKSI